MNKVRNIYFAITYPPGRLPRSLRSLAKTVKFPCRRERKRGDSFETIASSVIREDCRGRYAPSQRQSNFRVIASVSVAIPLKKYAVYTPYFTPTDCRGRYAPSQRQSNFRVIASVSVAIPLKKYAVYTPYFTPTDCRGRYAPYLTIKANAL